MPTISARFGRFNRDIVGVYSSKAPNTKGRARSSWYQRGKKEQGCKELHVNE
jgi:hypothetical protein